MELTQAVRQLDAAAEPSRLRLLVALLSGETTVGDLVAVLEQSQPRVSRHLRLLAEAGLLESFREGRSIYYRWSSPGLEAGIVSSVAALADSADPAITRDRERLRKLSRQRERDAVCRALRAGRARRLHASAADPEFADPIRGLLGPGSLGAVLHVGCSAGELLRSLLPDARMAVGTELSGHRRQIARARLRPAGLPRWTIRDADPTGLPFDAAAFDVVVLQDALGGDLLAVLSEAARVLRPAGRLLILERVLPTDSALAASLATLGFTVNSRQWLPGRTPDRALFLASRPVTTHARTGTDD